MSLQIPTKNTGELTKREIDIEESLLLEEHDRKVDGLAVPARIISNNTTTAATNDDDDDNNNRTDTRTCCASILNVYHELCNFEDVDDEKSHDTRLFVLLLVMALCGIVKSLIRTYEILWLPEAAGCILVGVLCGFISMFVPHHDISFDGNWFLRVLVPPIIFEAALSIDKKSFLRHVIPIILFAVLGTLFATVSTAIVVHYGTYIFSYWCTTIPFVEALTFGALISSIDPIAVLSVLSSMGMTDTDPIYVIIFGESLLNDGVAIVLFNTLVRFLDENLIIDGAAIKSAILHFFVSAFGSVFVGIASGWLSTVYFWAFYGCQTPLVELLMFFCWALLPYYVCDLLGLSGIVGTVAVGFCMDYRVVGERNIQDDSDGVNSTNNHAGSNVLNGDCNNNVCMDSSDRSSGSGKQQKARRRPLRRPLFNSQGHLSGEARTHIRFVVETISTIMETAIFAYLGFFLFSNRYDWNFFDVIIAVLACCVSRALMIPSLSAISNFITRIQLNNQDRFTKAFWSALRHRPVVLVNGLPRNGSGSPHGPFINRKMQIALWFAGLRGAMSFALVEYIPLYDSYSGVGTRLKPELKAMTSASIVFTTFVLGGYTYYMIQKLGIGLAPAISARPENTVHLEMTSLMSNGNNQNGGPKRSNSHWLDDDTSENSDTGGL